MNALQIVQSVAKASGWPVPTFLVAGTDAVTMQYLALLEEELDDLTVRENFGPLQRECVFPTQATSFQWLMADILGGDTMWKYVVDTFYDRTSHLAVQGPVTESEWQQYEALQAGMLPRFRFWQEGLYLQPAPPAGHTMAFEFLSQNCVVTAVTLDKKRHITADTDTFLIPDEIMKAGLKWRYKCEKGLAYGEDFARYERIRASQYLNGTPRKVVDLSCPGKFNGPGIIIPPGSWNIIP